MYPVIYKVGDFVISSYGLMLLVAFITCNIILRKIVLRNGLKQDIADDITFRAAFGGIIGAKIYYLLENISTGYALSNINGLWNIVKGVITFNLSLITSGIQSFGSGLVFLGGLLGGTFAVTLYIKQNKLAWEEVADWVAPLIALGHGIGRIGCFLVGDDYGKPTSSFLGVKFAEGLPVSNAGNLRQLGVNIDPAIDSYTLISVHPTQLYEMFLYFAIFLYLTKLVKYKRYNGQLMYEYLFLAGASRFVIEFIRLNPPYLFGLSGAQIISIIMILIGSLLMYSRNSGYSLGNGRK